VVTAAMARRRGEELWKQRLCVGITRRTTAAAARANSPLLCPARPLNSGSSASVPAIDWRARARRSSCSAPLSNASCSYSCIPSAAASRLNPRQPGHRRRVGKPSRMGAASNHGAGLRSRQGAGNSMSRNPAAPVSRPGRASPCQPGPPAQSPTERPARDAARADLRTQPPLRNCQAASPSGRHPSPTRAKARRRRAARAAGE
jgi:hypothetical protein